MWQQQQHFYETSFSSTMTEHNNIFSITFTFIQRRRRKGNLFYCTGDEYVVINNAASEAASAAAWESLQVLKLSRCRATYVRELSWGTRIESFTQYTRLWVSTATTRVRPLHFACLHTRHDTTISFENDIIYTYRFDYYLSSTLCTAAQTMRERCLLI